MKIYYKFKMFGIVIPCHNVENILNSLEFKEFCFKNTMVHICFVNDNSSDQTHTLLKSIYIENPNQFSIINLNSNLGKYEASKQGLIELYKKNYIKIFGILDPENPMYLNEWLNIANYKIKNPKFIGINSVFILKLKIYFLKIFNNSFTQSIFKKSNSIFQKKKNISSKLDDKFLQRESVPLFLSQKI